MRKSILPMLAALSLFLAIGGAQAQKKDDKSKPTAAQATKMGKMDASSGAVTVTGIVKAAPVGKTFMIAQGKKTTTVDAGGITLRYNGKFFALAKLTGGSMVSAKGTLAGSNLKATAITVTRLSGEKKVDKPGKMDKIGKAK